MVTREQLLGYIADKNLDYDDVYPKDDCIYKRKYEQLLKEMKVIEIKSQAFEEVAIMYINQEECNIPDKDILRVLKEQIDKYRKLSGGNR